MPPLAVYRYWWVGNKVCNQLRFVYGSMHWHVEIITFTIIFTESHTPLSQRMNWIRWESTMKDYRSMNIACSYPGHLRLYSHFVLPWIFSTAALTSPSKLHIYSFSFVAAGSLACRPSVQIYPIILTIVIFVPVISVLKNYKRKFFNIHCTVVTSARPSFGSFLRYIKNRSGSRRYGNEPNNIEHGSFLPWLILIISTIGAWHGQCSYARPNSIMISL